MGAAKKHPVPHRVKPSFVTLRAERQSARMSKNYKWRLNPVWYSMIYSCTQMATVVVKGFPLKQNSK